MAMAHMTKAWRSVIALAAAAAATLGTTSAAQAAENAEEFSFTPEKYTAVQFGTSKAEVEEFLGVGLTKPGSREGWCEGGVSLLCFTESNDYAPYGGFAFNANGELIDKRQEFLFKPKTPSTTLNQYNAVSIGMTANQLWSTVSPDSCVVSQERYTDWPATTNHRLTYYCTATTGLFPPNARFYVVDGKVTEKYQRSLT
ncbi:BLIP family protein [Streptomyces sp. NPDC093085]|uniref:BLIP family protein n=1 Tax=Streptomyces sp. NPDC093085 TaxID=3155068 RepID=UPI003420041E